MLFEVKIFFNFILKDSFFYFNFEVEIGEIVYKFKVNKEEWECVVNLLEELCEWIVEGGESFVELAGKYFDDGFVCVGGDLGWAKWGCYVFEFEVVVFWLEKDEIFLVIEFEFGFYII